VQRDLVCNDRGNAAMDMEMLLGEVE